MRHLHPDELIDVAEGTRPVSSAPHLQECQICRSQLADLRLVMNVARTVEVPEPSPFYWDHFSARVRDAVGAEGAPRPLGWPERWSWPRAGAPLRTVWAGAIAAIVLIASLTVARLARPPHAASGPLNPDDIVAASGGAIDTSALPSDSSLDLVADLTEDMDWDTAREGGFAPRQDAVERAVGEMTEVERRELRRLLKEELAKSN
jgi:hypothetical protein